MLETKRVFSGFIANGYGQGVTIFSQIILVPFFISSWGIQQYGDWLILIALPMYLSLSDMGFSTSTANEMCMLAGKDRDKEVMSIFASSWYLSIFLATILSIILFFIFLLLQHTGTYKFTSITPDDARFGFILYLIYMLLTVLCTSITVIYKFVQRYSQSIYIDNTTRLFESILTIILLIAKQDLTTVIAGMIMVRIFGLSCLIMVAKFITPDFSLKLSDFSIKKIKDITGSSLNFSLFSTAVNLFPQAFLIALGSTSSSQTVVGYTMVKTLARFGFQVLNSYNNSLSVEIAHLSGKKSWDKIFSLVDKSFIYFLTFSILYISVGLYSVNYIFKIWSRLNLQVNHMLFFLVSATSLTQSIWMLFFSVFASSNNHGKASKIYALISLLYLVIVFTMMRQDSLNYLLFLGLLVEVVMLVFLLKRYRIYKLQNISEYQ